MGSTLFETKLNKPRLRFKDDSGNDFPDWEKNRLSDFLIERDKMTPKSKQYPLMSFVGNKGVIPKGDRYDREFLVSDSVNKKYKQTEYGDFIYSSNNLETGSIGLNCYGSATISPVYSIFQVKESCDYRFIGSYLVRKSFMNKMVRYRQGVIYGQWKIHESDFLKIEEKIPNIKEQQKIADFLMSVDNWIDNLKAQKESLEKSKRGMMQKIFSREIRFKDDNGNDFPDWETRKLGTICDYKNGGSFEQSIVENGKYYLISLNSMTIQGNLLGSYKTVNDATWLLKKNDIVMVLSDVAHGYFLGLSDIIPENDKFVLNQRMGLLRVKDSGICTPYLRLYINHNQLYFKRHGQGSSQQNLSKGDIESFLVKTPSLQEQQKIADFLSSIDSQIDIKQKQIEQALSWKKGLMQEMFV